jgi:hypothetical protein
VNLAFEEGRADTLFVEQQRFGAEFIQAAIMGGRMDVLELGIKIIEWAFPKQADNGSFAGSRDIFHTTEIYLEAWARAALILREGGSPAWATVGPVWVPRIAACASWMIAPQNFEPGLENNRPMVHRYWILAAALQASAAVTGDDRFQAVASQLVREGTAAQLENGINPERGGYDVSYQSAGLIKAGRYWAATTDPRCREITRRMLERGLSWLMTKEDGLGNISTEGSTRAGKEKHRTGRIKGVNYWELIQAVVFTAHISQRAEFFDLARRVASRTEDIRPDDLL